MSRHSSPQRDLGKSTMTSTTASDINVLAEYLAHPEIQDLSSCEAVDCIVICVSAVFHGADTVLRALEARPSLTRSLVLCGGVGHSTPLIYEAVARSAKYRSIAGDIEGLSEAQVLHKIVNSFYDVAAITSQGCRILVEGRSTNCFLNAVETRRLLQASAVEMPRTCIVVQDPTMALRTTLCFRKVYEDTACTFLSCPLLVPKMRVAGSGLEFAANPVPAEELWEKQRFFELIMGEIPRLRDDEKGYGPKGTNSIPHVDIPDDVQRAWAGLTGIITSSR